MWSPRRSLRSSKSTPESVFSAKSSPWVCARRAALLFYRISEKAPLMRGYFVHPLLSRQIEVAVVRGV